MLTHPAPHVLVVATSLNADSNSAILAAYAHDRLQELGVACEIIDLRTAGDLPFAGSPAVANSQPLQHIKAAMRRATHILLAVPN